MRVREVVYAQFQLYLLVEGESAVPVPNLVGRNHAIAAIVGWTHGVVGIRIGFGYVAELYLSNEFAMGVRLSTSLESKTCTQDISRSIFNRIAS